MSCAARCVLLATVLAPAMSMGASFDCARAASPVERSICADKVVSELDDHMGRYYAGAQLALKESASCLQADQRDWLGRRNQCADRNCLENAYLDRLAELDALQPGASAIKGDMLPHRPGLVWIVPPAADKVAAPANPKAVPDQLHGVLLDEVAGGDGFVMRGAGGERRLVVPLMFIEPATAQRLSMLAREPDVTFIVRGHVAADGGRKYFEPSRCTFIHRVNAPFEGRIFPDPARAPAGFKPHELAFATPKDGVARIEFRSVPFYAVILRTAERCSIKETERAQVQALFASSKVFATRHGCDDSVEENITYTNVDPKWGFLAVYGGATEGEAREFLKKVNALGRFPGANVRRMQAVLVYP